MSPPRPRFAPDLEQLGDRDVPTVVAVTDIYQASTGTVLEVPASRGVLANDFSTVLSSNAAGGAGAVLTATLVTNPPASRPAFFDNGQGGLVGNQLAVPLPANTITLNPDGSFRIVVPSNVPSTASFLIFSYTAANALDPNEPTGVGVVYVKLNRPTAERYAVAPQAGAEPFVHVYEAGTNNLVQTFQAYELAFRGGVRVAVGDLNGDGVPDVATAPGEGGTARIEVFDGVTARLLLDAILLERTFTGGAYVAIGDFNGDSFNDLIVGAGVGGGPRVQVINGQDFLPTFPGIDNPFQPVNGGFNVVNGQLVNPDLLADFYAYEQSFRGGVKVAAGDVNGDGTDEVITAPGFGGGPVVRTFDFGQLVGFPSAVAGPPPGNVTRIPQPLSQPGVNFNGSAAPGLSFLAGAGSGREGVNIAAGDVLGDGRAEIITGASTGPAVVSIFNGTTGGLINQFGVPYQQTSTGNTGIGADGLLGGTLPPSGLLLGIPRPNTLIPSQDNGIRDNGALIPDPNGNLDVNTFALGGVTVATIDFDGDGKQDIIAGAGPGNSPRVRITRADGSALEDFLAFPANVLTGVFVG